MTTSAETITVMRQQERNSKNKWDTESGRRGEKTYQSRGQIKFTFLCFCEGTGKVSIKEDDVPGKISEAL